MPCVGSNDIESFGTTITFDGPTKHRDDCVDDWSSWTLHQGEPPHRFLKIARKVPDSLTRGLRKSEGNGVFDDRVAFAFRTISKIL
jgi:hypothetical protein